MIQHGSLQPGVALLPLKSVEVRVHHCCLQSSAPRLLFHFTNLQRMDSGDEFCRGQLAEVWVREACSVQRRAGLVLGSTGGSMWLRPAPRCYCTDIATYVTKRLRGDTPAHYPAWISILLRIRENVQNGDLQLPDGFSLPHWL